MSSNSKERKLDVRKKKRTAEQEAVHQRRIETAPIYPFSMFWGIGAAFIPAILTFSLLFVDFDSTGLGQRPDIIVATIIGGAILAVMYYCALFCAQTGFTQRPIKETLGWVFKSKESVNGLLSVLSVFILITAVMVFSGFGVGSQGFLAASSLGFFFAVLNAIKVSYRGHYYHHFSENPEADRKLEASRFDYRTSDVEDRDHVPTGPVNRVVTASRELWKKDSSFKERLSGMSRAIFLSRRVPGKAPGAFFKAMFFGVLVPGLIFSIFVALAIPSPLLLMMPTTVVPLICLVLWASWTVSERGFVWKTRLHREHTSMYRYFADEEILEGIDLYNERNPSWKTRRMLKDMGVDPNKSKAEGDPEPEEGTVVS